MPDAVARGVRCTAAGVCGPARAEADDVFVHGPIVDNLASSYLSVDFGGRSAFADVLTYDLRGHGRSERPKEFGYGVASMVLDLSALLDSTLGLNPMCSSATASAHCSLLEFARLSGAGLYPVLVLVTVISATTDSPSGWCDPFPSRRGGRPRHRHVVSSLARAIEPAQARAPHRASPRAGVRNHTRRRLTRHPSARERRVLRHPNADVSHSTESTPTSSTKAPLFSPRCRAAPCAYCRRAPTPFSGKPQSSARGGARVSSGAPPSGANREALLVRGSSVRRARESDDLGGARPRVARPPRCLGRPSASRSSLASSGCRAPGARRRDHARDRAKHGRPSHRSSRARQSSVSLAANAPPTRRRHAAALARDDGDLPSRRRGRRPPGARGRVRRTPSGRALRHLLHHFGEHRQSPFGSAESQGDAIDDEVARLERDAGLEPSESPDTSPELVVVFSTEALVGRERAWPEHFRFVGPSMKSPRPDALSLGSARPQDAHLVSLGTISTDAGTPFYAATAAALGDLDAQVIVAANPSLLPDPPGNFLVRPRVPQLALLPHVDAVVCHAGHNTVCEALANGLPLVVAPIRDDQPVIAQQVVRAGAGVRVRYGRLSLGSLREAVLRVLGEPSFPKRGAKRSATRFVRGGARPPPTRWWAWHERVVGCRNGARGAVGGRRAPTAPAGAIAECARGERRAGRRCPRFFRSLRRRARRTDPSRRQRVRAGPASRCSISFHRTSLAGVLVLLLALDPKRFRGDRFARGFSAATPMLVHASVLGRLGAPAEPADAVAMAELARRLKLHAATTSDVTVAPALVSPGMSLPSDGDFAFDLRRRGGAPFRRAARAARARHRVRAGLRTGSPRGLPPPGDCHHPRHAAEPSRSLEVLRGTNVRRPREHDRRGSTGGAAHNGRRASAGVRRAPFARHQSVLRTAAQRLPPLPKWRPVEARRVSQSLPAKARPIRPLALPRLRSRFSESSTFGRGLSFYYRDFSTGSGKSSPRPSLPTR